MIASYKIKNLGFISTKLFAAIILSFALFFTGCMRHKKHDPKVKADIVFGDSADFDIVDVAARPLNQDVELFKHAGWKVPLYKTYEFVVKLRDGLQGRSLRDFQFKVTKSDGEQVCDVNTNSASPRCEFKANTASEIRWTEAIPYDFFKKSSDSSLLVRKIKGSGGRTGQRTMVVEVNPWSTIRGLNVPEVRDITFNLSEEQAELIKNKSYNETSSLKIGDNEEEKAKLVVDSIDTQVIKSIEPFLAARSDSLVMQQVSERGNFYLQNLVYSRYAPRDFVSRQNSAGATSDFKYLKSIQQGASEVYVYQSSEEESGHVDGLRFDVDLRMNLGYQYIKPDGSTEAIRINDGRFRVLSALVLEPDNGQAPVILTPNMNPMVTQIFEGRLYVNNYKAVIPYLPSSGNIKLAIRIIPLGLEQQLSHVDYLYTLGTYKDLIGRNGSLFPDESTIKGVFNYESYLKSAQSGAQAFANGYAYKSRDYNFGTMDIKFSTVEAGETASQRTVIFRVGTKVYDESTGGIANPNTPFEIVSVHRDLADPEDESKWKFRKITNADQTNDPSRVNRDGQIFWYDKMTHKYYQKEKLVKRSIFISRWKPSFNEPGFDFIEEVKKHIKGEGTHKDVRIQELRMYINPWDEKFGTFGTDARIASESFIQNIESRDKIESRFFIGRFNYETLRFRYGIDESMDLNVKKTVLLTLDPLVLRYSSILQGINSVGRIRDGIYLLKAALQKDYLDPAARNLVLLSEQEDILNGLVPESDLPSLVIDAPLGDSKVLYDGKEVGDGFQIPYGDPRRKRSLSFVKKLVRVNAGKIITPVEFSIEDLRLMRIRGQFFVQLQLVNQVRLQLVNIVKEKFEKVFQFETGKNSPILQRFTPQEQAKIKSQMQEVLDAIAMSVDDDVYISAVDDLQEIVENPRVQTAISNLESSKVGYLVKDILLDIKRSYEDSLVEQKPINDESIDQIKAEREQEQEQKNQVAAENERLSQTVTQNAVDPISQTVKNNKCEPLGSVHQSNGYIHYNGDGDDKDIDPLTRAYIPFDTGVFPDDYSDQLSKFKPFADRGKQFFSELVSEETLDRVLTNDFTVSPAFGPVSDLDMLIDKNSGIRSRTFVGPMTFLYNTNSGSLRPTDNLDEAYCVTDDCNSLHTSLVSQYGVIENFEYEKSPYHGSIAHFQNVVFEGPNGIEKMYRDLQAAKKARKYADSLVTRFLDQYDMSYLSLTDKAPLRLVCKDNIMPGSDCYQKDTYRFKTMNKFLDQYSKVVKEIVDLDYKTKSQPEARFQKLEQSLISINNSGSFRTAYGPAEIQLPYGFMSATEGVGLERCERGVQSSVCQEGNLVNEGILGLGRKFAVDLDYKAPNIEELQEIIKVPYTNKEMVSAGHTNFSMSDYTKMCDLLTYGEIGPKAYANVNDESQKLRLRANLFRMSTFCKKDLSKGLMPLSLERRFRIKKTGRYYFLGGKSMNINASQNVQVSNSLRVSRAFGVRPLRALTGVVEKGPSFASKIGGLLLGSFDFSYNLSRDKNFNENTGINKGTYLVMQNAEFEVELESYEQCVIARWSSQFIDQHERAIGFSEGEFSKDLVRGLYICSGEVENTPIAVKENYYYFTQHFTEGDMLDSADIHNHPWLLALRGVREFETFMMALQSYEDSGEPKNLDEKASAYGGIERQRGDELIGAFDMIKDDITNVRRRMNGDYNPTSHYTTVERKDWPIHQMVTTYNNVMPTFPGTYTQLNRQEYNERTWPWQTTTPGAVLNSSQVCK